MSACFHSGRRRLSAVLFCLFSLWAFAAHAHTRNSFSFVPEQAQKPSFSLRLEAENPRQTSPPLAVSLYISPDGRIGIFAGGEPIDFFDADGRQGLDQYEIQIENNQVRTWTPAGQQQYQNETTEQAIENGDFQAYNQGQQERAAETTAVALPVMGVASVAALPAGPEGEAVTWSVARAAALRGALVTGTASATVGGTVAYQDNQPVTPAIVSGFSSGGVAGATTGFIGPWAQTLSPVASLVVNSAAGFAGGFLGNSAGQVYQNNGLNNYELNDSLFAGSLAAILNPAEANVSATSEGFLPQTPLFKAAQVSLDYGIGVGDSSFESFLDQQSPNSESQPAPAYTPGPMGGKH
jgi:hypothetical protein